MTGPQIILIPGLLNDAELWRDQIGPLSDVGRPVVAEIAPYATLAEMSDRVLDLAEAQFVLVGFSLGGIVALEVMRRAGQRVTHLALLDTTMLPDSPDRAQERSMLLRLAQSPGRFHGFGDRILDTYLAPENREIPEVAARIRSMTQRLGAEVFVRQTLIERPDHRAVAAGIACPTLVLCGESDRITPPEKHREMAIAIPLSQLKILPHSGHMTPIEQPDLVSDALKALIRRPS